ncbi:hypothetical protein YPPY55_1171, partial [Yersinia pestis PY-55]
MIAANSGG